MSKKIEKKVQQTFIDSITIKQKILDEGAHEILIEAGKHIVESITGGGKLLICGKGGSAAAAAQPPSA